MDKPEQVGSAHDNLSDLLHAIAPPTLLRMVAAAGGLLGIDRVEIEYRDPRVQIIGLAHPAGTKIVDGIYTVHTAGKVVEIWLFEVELDVVKSKVRKWSLYVVAFEHELDATGHLAVFSPVPDIREGIRTKLIPRMRIDPILIEPDHIERITDYDDARARPELTILGCLFHCHEPAPLEDRVAVLRAAMVAIRAVTAVDTIQAWRYTALVMQLVPPEVVKQGEQEMHEAGELDEHGKWLVSESERYGHSFHLGLEEGRQEGREEGREAAEAGFRAYLRLSIVQVLELRGFILTDAQRERIAACDSLEMLERWGMAAQTAAATASVDELLFSVSGDREPADRG